MSCQRQTAEWARQMEIATEEVGDLGLGLCESCAATLGIAVVARKWSLHLQLLTRCALRTRAELADEVEALANGLLAAQEGPTLEYDDWLQDLEAEARRLAARMRATVPAKGWAA